MKPKKFFAAILSSAICLTGVGLGGCVKTTSVIQDGVRYTLQFPRGGKNYFACDTYEDLENPVVDALFLMREANGTLVKGLGAAPGYGSTANRIDMLSNSIEIASVYCPGTITNCVSDYFAVHNIDDPEADLRIFYCGEVADLSVLGYGAGILYYVPFEQLAEYEELWATYYSTVYAADDVRIKAANVEYHLNAEGLEEFYYVDYVESGETIRNIPPEPTRKGYRFLGWYSDEDGMQEFDFDSPIAATDGSLALFAKWKEK